MAGGTQVPWGNQERHQDMVWGWWYPGDHAVTRGAIRTWYGAGDAWEDIGGWWYPGDHEVSIAAIRTWCGAAGTHGVAVGDVGQPAPPWDGARVPGHPPLTRCPCPQEELQAWLQGLSAAIGECQGWRGKAQSLPPATAPPAGPLPRKDKEKRFSFFPKKK